MIEYKTGKNGIEIPVLKPLAVVLLYVICGVYAVCCGAMGKISILALMLLPLAVAAAVLGFLLCRPRVWHYLLLPYCAIIAFLCGGGVLGAFLALDFFLLAFLVAVCLRRNVSYTACIGILLLVIAVILGVALLGVAEENGFGFTFSGVGEWLKAASDELRFTLQKLIRVTYSDIELDAVFGGKPISVDELIAQVTAAYDGVLRLLPGLCGAVLTVLAYGCTALSFRFLTLVPSFRAALARKKIAFARPWGFFFLALWILQIFLTTETVFGMAMLNLYLLILPAMAYVGFAELWRSRRGPYGQLRVFTVVLLILCAVSLTMPSYLFSYTLPFLAFYGAVITAMKRRI